MDKKISRRQILGIGAATLAGSVALLGKEAQAKSSRRRLVIVSAVSGTTEVG